MAEKIKDTAPPAPAAKDEKPPVPAAAPAAAGVRVKAPEGMETISVGGIQFKRDGGGFVLPEALVAAALAHIKSFVDKAKREAARAEAEAAAIIAKADLPGRIEALERRFAAIEDSLGLGRGARRG